MRSTHEILISLLVLVGAASVADPADSPVQAQQPTIQGRLLDGSRKPISGITLTLCETVPDSSGNVGQFVTMDAKGSTRVASLKERGTLERTFFAQYKDGTWATAVTQDDGRFAFDGEIVGTYCLAADSPGGVPRKLKLATGELITVELSTKSPKANLGDLVVKW